MYSLSQEPDRPDLISSGTQLHQPLPLAHCRSDRPVHSKHVQIQQLSKTAPEKGFQSKYQEIQEHMQCLQLPCGAEESNWVQSIPVLNQNTQTSIMWYWICSGLSWGSQEALLPCQAKETLFIHKWTSFDGHRQRAMLKKHLTFYIKTYCNFMAKFETLHFSKMV